jgi:hypothetical protein
MCDWKTIEKKHTSVNFNNIIGEITKKNEGEVNSPVITTEKKLISIGIRCRLKGQTAVYCHLQLVTRKRKE